jgi:hypothetical protein
VLRRVTRVSNSPVLKVPKKLIDSGYSPIVAELWSRGDFQFTDKFWIICNLSQSVDYSPMGRLASSISFQCSISILIKNDVTTVKVFQMVMRSTILSLHNSRWSHVWRYTEENSTKFICCRIWNDLSKLFNEFKKVFMSVFRRFVILNGILRCKTARLSCNNWELNSKINLLVLCCVVLCCAVYCNIWRKQVNLRSFSVSQFPDLSTILLEWESHFKFPIISTLIEV